MPAPISSLSFPFAIRLPPASTAFNSLITPQPAWFPSLSPCCHELFLRGNPRLMLWSIEKRTAGGWRRSSGSESVWLSGQYVSCCGSIGVSCKVTISSLCLNCSTYYLDWENMIIALWLCLRRSCCWLSSFLALACSGVFLPNSFVQISIASYARALKACAVIFSCAASFFFFRQ